MFAGGEEDEIIISIMSTFTSSFLCVSSSKGRETHMRSFIHIQKTLDAYFISTEKYKHLPHFSGGFSLVVKHIYEYSSTQEQPMICWRDIMHIERKS